MFHYFFKRMSVLLRTDKSILRRDMRNFRKIFREKPELLQHFVEAMAAAERSGDVDKVDATVKEVDKKFTKLLTKFVESEEDIAVVEGDVLKRLTKVELLYDRLHKSRAKIEKLPDGNKLVAKLDAVGVELAKLVHLEDEVLRDEEILVNREVSGKRGEAQNFVVAVTNERQQIFDILWNERSEVRTTKRDAKKVADEEDEILRLLKESELHPKVVKRLPELIDKLLKASKELYEEYHKSLLGFAQTMKVLVDVYFKMHDEKDAVFKKEFDKLKATGFPTADLEADLAALHRDEHEEKDELSDLGAIMTRMARLMLRQAMDERKLKAA